jgi:hypothetical protein
MKIGELVFDLLLEEVKQKNLFNALLKKWREESPQFNALDPEKQLEVGEKIFVQHSRIKNSIGLNIPAVASFLARYDGEHGSAKYDLNTLKDIQKLPLPKLVEFLTEWGKFYLDVNLGGEDEVNQEEKEEELKIIFDKDGPKVSNDKLEASKALWYDENSTLVSKPNFRAYEIMNEEMSKRFGYYYQTMHKKAWMTHRGANDGVSVNNPWCVTWRGNSFSEYPTYDENGDGQGKPLFTHGGNLYGSYRREGRTFFFIIDENKSQDDRYYMGALQKIGANWRLTSMFNDGDTTMTWNRVVEIYPELDNERDLFNDRPLDNNELNQNSILNIVNENGGPNDFTRQSPARKDQYVTLGGYITKPRSWSVMNADLRDKYINTIGTDNAFQKIRNEELLNAILETPGFKDSLIRRLKIINKDLSYIVDNIMQQNYEVEYTGKKNKDIRIYRNKNNHRYGIFDILNNKWLIHDGIKYESNFEESNTDLKEFEIEGGEMETILIIEYTNPNNEKFYTIQIGLSVSNDDSVAKVYILSGKQYASLGNMFDERPNEFSDKDVDLGEIEKGL